SIEPCIKYLSDALDMKIINKHIDQYYLSGRKNLANCNIKERIITIDLSVVNTIRYLFTLCHEFSHFLLHKNVVIKQSEYETVSDDFFKYKSKKDNLITDRDWVEWQANELAVNLILPEVPFKAKVSQLLGEMGRTIDLPFYLGHHYSNYKEYNRLLDNLSKHYHVSRTMISIRLNYFGLVHDQKNTKGLSNWGDSFDKVS
ncbi:MAG: ImmA/IrrE family metallo-endopeptidase, partial [Bacteroidota bacterium]